MEGVGSLFPGESLPKTTLSACVKWLRDNKHYDGDPVSEDDTSGKKLYDIQNDKNFDWASAPQAAKHNSLFVDEDEERAEDELPQIGVGRYLITDWNQIAPHAQKLLEEVYRQHLDSQGEKPKLLKLAVYCHGWPSGLGTSGRDPKDDKATPGSVKKAVVKDTVPKVGHDLSIAGNLTQFVASFTVNNPVAAGKLFADSALVALYACSAGRSKYTDEEKKKSEEGRKVDGTYGQDPPTGRELGEESFATTLHALLLQIPCPSATVTSHTTVGDADGNPHVRIFSVDSSQKPIAVDLVNLFYDAAYRKAHPDYLKAYKQKTRTLYRDAMFTSPRGLLGAPVQSPVSKDLMKDIQAKFL